MTTPKERKIHVTETVRKASQKSDIIESSLRMWRKMRWQVKDPKVNGLWGLSQHCRDAERDRGELYPRRTQVRTSHCFSHYFRMTWQ
jgi:hypothetical protein